MPGVWEQIRTIAWLRRRIFWNSLRTWRAKAELIAYIVVGIIAAAASAAVGLGLGGAAYYLAMKGRWEAVAGLLWGIFGFWLLFPFLVAMTTNEFDYRGLLKFPLRFPTFYVLSVIYGVLDPVAVTGVFWLGCAGTGVVLAKPGLATATIASLAIFAGVTLLLNRVLFTWLERVLANRKQRERVFLVFLLGMMSVQLLVVAGKLWEKQLWPFVAPLHAATEFLPPAAAAEAIGSVDRGNAGRAILQLSLLTAYAAGLALIFRRRLHELYRGEEAGWSSGDGGGAGDRTVRPAWHLPGLRGSVAAVVEKEVKYFFRNGPIALQVIVPAFMIGFFALVWRGEVERPGFLKQSPELMFPSAVAYALLILTPMIQNSFAYDARGVQTLLLAPVKFRDVLEGKNLVQGALIAGEGLLIWTMLSLTMQVPAAATTAATLAALAFAGMVYVTTGNLLSLKYPRRFAFGQFQQRQSGMSILVGLVVQVVVMAVLGGVMFAANRLGAMWHAAGIFTALGAAAWQAYVLGLEHCEKLAEGQREALLMELCTK